MAPKFGTYGASVRLLGNLLQSDMTGTRDVQLLSGPAHCKQFRADMAVKHGILAYVESSVCISGCPGIC